MPMYIPPEHELTDNQLEVRDVPLTGRYLITGGPGCGKTSIALYRTMYIKRENPTSRVATFLFTNALNDFFIDGVHELNIGSQVRVWAKWQMEFLRNHGQTWPEGVQVPWNQLSQMILEYEIEKQYDHLIIDEGQDFADADLRVMNLLAENITMFADTNQSIRDLGQPNQADRLDTIREILNIDEEDCFELKENHRNTKRIIEAAMHLAPTPVEVDFATIKRDGTKPKLIQYSSQENLITFLHRIISDPRSRQRDIAILHLKKAQIKSLYEALQEKVNGDVILELLRQGKFNFSRPSVKFCTLDSVKGLEFDIVIMPCMSKDDYWASRTNQTRIYVGMTRPRHDLLMVYPAGGPTPYLFDIPKDKVDQLSI